MIAGALSTSSRRRLQLATDSLCPTPDATMQATYMNQMMKMSASFAAFKGGRFGFAIYDVRFTNDWGELSGGEIPKRNKPAGAVQENQRQDGHPEYRSLTLAYARVRPLHDNEGLRGDPREATGKEPKNASKLNRIPAFSRLFPRLAGKFFCTGRGSRNAGILEPGQAVQARGLDNRPEPSAYARLRSRPRCRVSGRMGDASARLLQSGYCLAVSGCVG